MIIQKLGQDEERGYGFSHHIQITSSDMSTFTTASSTGTVALLSAPAGYYLDNVAFLLTTPFKNSADSAFNTTGVTVGDAGQVARLIASTETNANGSYVSGGAGNSTYIPCGIVFNSATQLNAIFTPTSGKKLSDLNAGQLDIFIRLKPLASLVA